MLGDIGVDTLDYSSSNAGVSVSLTTAILSGGHATGDDIIDPSTGRVSFENLRGSIFGDVLEGTAGINVLEGRDGDDQLIGLGSSDSLFGGAGNDTLDGGSGSDLLVGGAGGDIISGGSGRDMVDYSDSDAAVTVLLNVIAIGGHADGDVLTGIEDATGSDFDDFLQGTNGGNSLLGGDGFDFLRGAGGNDILFGGEADDLIEGGAGADTLDGGGGTGDLISLLDATAPVTLDLSNVAASSAEHASDVFINMEGALGSQSFSNTMIGTGAAESFIGGTQGDSMVGNGGDDALLALAGNDTLDGGAGLDAFLGGLGDDRHTGGTGADTFLFEFNSGADVITDFTIAEGDFILFFGNQFTGPSDITVGTVAGTTDAILSWGSVAAPSSVILEGVTEADVNANFVFLVA